MDVKGYLCVGGGFSITLNTLSGEKIKQEFIAVLFSSDVYYSSLNGVFCIFKTKGHSRFNDSFSGQIDRGVFSTIGTPHTLGHWQLLIMQIGATCYRFGSQHLKNIVI